MRRHIRSNSMNWSESQWSDRIENLRKLYFDHFSSWLERHEPDWVFAMNLTLPHAVSVTSALYMAADLHFCGRAGWTRGLGP